jgi:hypothetical protein
MSTAGRPHALDETKKSQLLALLKSGCGKLTAARAVNCHPQTIRNTAKRDPVFAEQLADAETAAQLVHLENLNKAAGDVKYWRASAWIVERLNPQTFGKAVPNAITPRQLAAIFDRIGDAVAEEVPIARFRKQLIKRIDQILKEPNPSKIAVPKE